MAKKKSRGRPSDYNPDYCYMLLKHMEDGYSFESFGGLIKCGKQTLYNWTEKYPEFMDAKRIGWAIALLYWEKIGKDGMYNETIKEGKDITITRSLNATMWIFNMKNRFGWRDSRDSEREDAESNAKKSHQENTVDQLLDWMKKLEELKK